VFEINNLMSIISFSQSYSGSFCSCCRVIDSCCLTFFAVMVASVVMVASIVIVVKAVQIVINSLEH
jgi:hypothetical protein